MAEPKDEKNVGLNNVGDGIDKLLESTSSQKNIETSSAVATTTEIEQVVGHIVGTKNYQQHKTPSIEYWQHLHTWYKLGLLHQNLLEQEW